MHARQTAWFAAVPDGSKISRLQQRRSPPRIDTDEDEAGHDSAHPEVPEETQEIPYPELPPGAEYLVSLFHSAGTATPTGMGLVPLSWQEIESWVRCQGLENSVTPWELRTIKLMSEAYTNEYSHARDPKRPMPYKPPVDPDKFDRVAAGKKFKNILAQFKKKTT